MATSFEKPRDLVGGLVIVAIGGVFLLFLIIRDTHPSLG